VAAVVSAEGGGHLTAYERNYKMAIDANSLGDPDRIRQTELHALHDQATRVLFGLRQGSRPDGKPALPEDLKAAEAELANVAKAIAAFYAEDDVKK
jgi:hypothetical protein